MLLLLLPAHSAHTCVHTTTGTDQRLFRASFFGGGEEFPPNVQFPPFPQTASKLCPLNLSSRDSTLQIHQRNSLLTDNKHRKLFVIKQSKDAYNEPKYIWRPGSARTRWGELMRSSRPPSRNGDLRIREERRGGRLEMKRERREGAYV